MNMDKAIDNLDVEVLRNIIKDECNNKYNARIINAINLIENDKTLVKNQKLFMEFKYIDEKLDGVINSGYDLDAFDYCCFSLECVLKDLEKEIKNCDYEHPIRIVAHMLEASGEAFRYITDGFEYVVEPMFYSFEKLYKATRDNRLLKGLIAGMAKDKYRKINQKYLLKIADENNNKFMLECLKKEATAFDNKIIYGLLSYSNITTDDKISMYTSHMTSDSYVKCLELLYNENRLIEFDEIYYHNKDVYEPLLVNSKIYEGYYRLIYNRYIGNANRIALDSLRMLIKQRFNPDYFEKSLLLSSEEEEINFYRNNSTRSLCDIYLYLKKYDVFKRILIRNKKEKLYDYYLKSYGKVFKDEYFSFYKSLILEKLLTAKKREEYHDIAVEAMKLLELDLEESVINEFISYIKKNYAKKKSLMEELSTFFSYSNK